jgi:sporulation protein YlmC with PRC-barrel domain
LEQGQRANETARGSGFRIGSCSFQAGDLIKAEVDDNGRVTTLKYLAAVPEEAPHGTGLGAGTGELALANKQDKPAEVDMTGRGGYPPKEYSVVPLRLGPLEQAGDNNLIQRPIYNLQGQKVGTLENLLMDQATGRIEYAVILVEHTEHHLHPLPWSAIQMRPDPNGGKKLVVDTQKYKIHPDVTAKDVKDLSPGVEQLVQKMNELRQREATVVEQRPVDHSSVGVMGEEEAGGAGPSGPSGPPPGPAPGFEHEKDRP